MIAFDAFAKNRLPLLDKTLKELLEPLESQDLRKASLYALKGGKRVRPLLTLAAVADFSPKSLKKAFVPAAGLEMIHTYSLIHDDLPCMDNDDVRRGRKSLHRAFPEWLALLTGDFLLTYPFEIIASSSLLSSQEKTELLFCLSFRSGRGGMIAGQVDDLNFQGKKISWPALKKMHELKTASLFMTAMEFGAILCHLSPTQRKSMICFGEKIGLAYQIIDDLADNLQAGGSDQINEKATVIAALGRKKATQMALRLLKNAEDLLLATQKADLLLSFVQLLQNSFKNF